MKKIKKQTTWILKTNFFQQKAKKKQTPPNYMLSLNQR